MKPTPGRIVHYALTAEDAKAVNLRREDHDSYRAKHAAAAEPGDPGKTGHVGHVGNTVYEGDQFPAMIVRAWDTPTRAVNLQVFLDGADTYWATSRTEGDGPGSWHWPARVEHEAGDRPAQH